ncbi:MAG: hypothetical protein H7145_15515 [Akkermansiaceae bacterium]|nr:hypothetical protein [Armatimonadota bacterium]
MHRVPPGRTALIIGLWIVTLGIGFTALWRHSGTAGASPVILAESTREGDLLFDSGVVNSRGQQNEPLLLLFAHPHCPCTAASLNELNRALASAASAKKGGVPARVVVVFVVPPDAPPRWERTALWEQVGKMPGVRVCADKDGVLARRFDARTSGQMFLYDKNNRLVFEGGITDGRGHEGRNAGSDAVTTLLGKAYDSPPTPPVVRHTPVFGCALL